MDFKGFDITSTKRMTGKGASKYRKEKPLSSRKKAVTGSISSGPSSGGSVSKRSKVELSAVSSFIRGNQTSTIYQWCGKCKTERVFHKLETDNLIACGSCEDTYKLL